MRVRRRERMARKIGTTVRIDILVNCCMCSVLIIYVPGYPLSEADEDAVEDPELERTSS